MAYVAINPAFIGRVEAKINSMLEAEVKTLGEAPLPVVSASSDFFMDNVWGEHRHLHTVMPEAYKQKASEYRFYFNLQGRSFQFSVGTSHLGHVFPPNYSWYSSHEAQWAGHPEVQPLVDYCARKTEILDRWDNVDAKVIGFLKECKSANEAVKLWPDVKAYLDADDLRRIELKQDREKRASKAAEALADLDTDELMGAAVIARLSGADV